MLTPQETEALFATLQQLVGEGLSIIFISHKLDEVLAVSDRVAVLRGGKLVGERATAEADRERAGRADGRPRGRRADASRAAAAGRRRLRARAASRRPAGGAAGARRRRR